MTRRLRDAAPLREIEDALYKVVLTLLCPAGRHRLAVVYRRAPETPPSPVGEVFLPDGTPTGWWSDGEHHEIRRLRGAALVVADDGVTPLKLNARCYSCPGKQNPQLAWGRLVGLVDDVERSGRRRASVPLRI